MKNRFAAILAAIAIVLTVVPFVQAAVQGGCTVSDTSKVEFYENSVGDTSDGNDSRWYCGNASVMGEHTVAGTCKGLIPFNETWDECVSSYRLWVPSGQRFCAYRDPSYGGTVILNKLGPWTQDTQTNVPTNDAISSLRFVSSGSSC